MGAIIVIATFYTQSIDWSNLVVAAVIFGILLFCSRMKVKFLLIYLIGGVFMWYFMHHSGVHATISGVLLAFTIPFGKEMRGSEEYKNSISYKLQHALHKPVAFFILPVFAIANTAIHLNIDFQYVFSQKYSLGIILGLVVGKPLGVYLLSFFMVKMKLGQLPGELNWRMIIGVGILAGIGFTMSIFITLLAFDDMMMINNSKFVVLASSLIAGVIGYIFLKSSLKK